MKRLRSFLSDLALIPHMWRHLAAQTRKQLARDAVEAAWKASPGFQALKAKYGEGYRFSGYGEQRALAELGFTFDGRPL